MRRLHRATDTASTEPLRALAAVYAAAGLVNAGAAAVLGVVWHAALACVLLVTAALLHRVSHRVSHRGGPAGRRRTREDRHATSPDPIGCLR
jgi:fatty acid desaturase